MNKALSVFLPIFVAWGFLSAEERSKGEFRETTAKYISEVEISPIEARGPAAADNDNTIGDDPVPLFPAYTASDDSDVERDWISRREELYDNVGLTSTEIAWLNEIEDVTNANVNRVTERYKTVDPEAKKKLFAEVQRISSESTDQKEDYLGTERFQYLIQNRGVMLEYYRLRTGREAKVRW